MNENIETVVDETTDTVTDTDTETTETEVETEVDGADDKTPVTYTEEEVSKKIQSAEDKLRTKYTKEIKGLNEQIKKLSPVEKSESEIEIENRLAELEKAQNEVNAQKQFLALQSSLKEKGIDENVATYLKDGVDVEAFSTLFDKILTESAKGKGFIPQDHQSSDNVTVEQFRTMNMDKRSELYTKNPTLYEKLSKKLKGKN